MGSSGTGRLTDYSGIAGIGGNQGGSSGSNDKCGNAISEQLEEVARCAYYLTNNSVPPEGLQITLVQGTRITVTTLAGEEIGYLPTQFNYLASCLANGYKYSGTVVRSANTRIPAVLVSLKAETL
jgi:hypothetical protein